MEGRAHRSWLGTNRVKIALGIAIFEGFLVAFEKDFSRITVIVIAVPIILFYLLAGRSVESRLNQRCELLAVPRRPGVSMVQTANSAA